MTAQEDAIRLEEIKLTADYWQYLPVGAAFDTMALLPFCRSDVPWLISQAEKIAKVEDSLRVAEEALEFYEQPSFVNHDLDVHWDEELARKYGKRAREALKKIRGEK